MPPFCVQIKDGAPVNLIQPVGLARQPEGFDQCIAVGHHGLRIVTHVGTQIEPRVGALAHTHPSLGAGRPHTRGRRPVRRNYRGDSSRAHCPPLAAAVRSARSACRSSVMSSGNALSNPSSSEEIGC